MIETFSYKTKLLEKTYQHTIHSDDIKSSLEKWVGQIEDLQNQVYSFDKIQVQNIKQQYLNGQLQIHIDKEPCFISYMDGDKNQIVNIDKVVKDNPDFVAKVSYLATEKGGRQGYALSGYRPQVMFSGRKEVTSGEQLFVDKDKVFPGDTVTAEIRIVSKDLFKNYLFVGQHFEFSEGTRIIGHGEILDIINPILRQVSR